MIEDKTKPARPTHRDWAVFRYGLISEATRPLTDEVAWTSPGLVDGFLLAVNWPPCTSSRRPPVNGSRWTSDGGSGSTSLR